MSPSKEKESVQSIKFEEALEKLEKLVQKIETKKEF